MRRLVEPTDLSAIRRWKAPERLVEFAGEARWGVSLVAGIVAALTFGCLVLGLVLGGCR